MKKLAFRLNLAIALAAMCSFSIIAQNASSTADKFVISARAGGVNALVGDVSVKRTNGRVGRLFKGDEVQIGEKVSTGIDGKAEILMNPGSYVRLGANSSFEFDSTDLDDVRIRMHSGSAIFEIFGAEDFKVDLSAGNSQFDLIETGIYRVDLTANGKATLFVVKGKAQVDAVGVKPLTSGKMAAFTGSEYMVAKFDKKNNDDLALWSSSRAKELSRISSSLRPDRLRDPLINSFYGRHWNMYNSFGLWVYDPFFSSYCFLPFGQGWFSPYGYGFGRSIWYYRLPRSIYAIPAPTDTSGRNPRIIVDPSNGELRKSDPGTSNNRGDNNRKETKEPMWKPVEPVFSAPRFDPPVMSEPKISIPRGTDRKP